MTDTTTAFRILLVAGILALGAASQAQDLPLVYQDSFERTKAAAAWFPTDPSRWTVDDLDGNHVLHLHGVSKYNPPYRSPHSITLLKNKVLADFVITAKVKTLQTSRGHRDMCLFFGWQNPSHFYYVHLGEKVDPNSSQIFIVHDNPRTPITKKNAGGVPWDNKRWHDVKIVRKVESGLIEVYFDDMNTPMKVASDKTFQWGLVGLGSFDDLGLWDDIRINGVLVKGREPVLPEPLRKGPTENKRRKK